MRRVRKVPGVLALLLLAACGADEFHENFVAERRMWQADRDLAAALAAQAPSRDASLSGLLERYRALGDATLALANSPDADPELREDVQELSIQAHFREAQVAVALVDSLRLIEIYQRATERFLGLDEVSARTRLALARVERNRGRIGAAMQHLERGCRVEGVAIERACCLELADLQAWQENWDRALQLLERLRTELDSGRSSAELREVELRRIEIMLRRGDDPDSVLVQAHAFQGRHARSESARRGLLLVAESLLDDRPQLAIELADSVLAGGRDPEDIARAMLVQGKVLERQDDWAQALAVLRRLIAEYPITEAAIRTHETIAAHFRRTGQVEDEGQAIDRGIATLADMLVSYPGGPHEARLRAALVELMRRDARDEELLELMISIASRERGRPAELEWLVAAGRHCAERLGDPVRAAELLSEAAARFPRTELGRWAGARAAALATRRPDSR